MPQAWMESFLFLLELIHPANSKEHIRKNEYNNIAVAVLWTVLYSTYSKTPQPRRAEAKRRVKACNNGLVTGFGFAGGCCRTTTHRKSNCREQGATVL